MHSTTLGRVWSTPESDQRWYPERGSCHPRITIDAEQFLRADTAAITGLGAGAIMGEGAGTGFRASTGITLATIGRNSRSTQLCASELFGVDIGFAPLNGTLRSCLVLTTLVDGVDTEARGAARAPHIRRFVGHALRRAAGDKRRKSIDRRSRCIVRSAAT